MTPDTTALLIAILLMVLIAAWVPFLDTCAGCLERRRQRRSSPSTQGPSLVVRSSNRSRPESPFEGFEGEDRHTLEQFRP